MTVVVETTEIYAHDFHLAVFGSIRPILCAPEYVRRMRRHYYFDIEKILNWDEEKKNKLIDFLVEVVSAPNFYDEDFEFWLEEVERKLQELKEFEEFNRLKGYLERIDQKQREKIVDIAVNRIMSSIDTILREFVYQMPSVDEKSLKELFVVGSMLRVVRRLLEYYRRSRDKKILTLATVLILRFAAYVRGKIGINDLMRDMSISVGHLREKVLSDDTFRDIVCNMQ